jgi:hypothetical protein
MRSLSRIVCASALLACAGCSDEEPETEDAARIAQLNQNTDFRLDGTTFDVNRYEVAPLPPEGDTITLGARSMAYTCIGGDPNNQLLERAFRADIHIANPATLPLGMPVDVGDPTAPIQAELSALDFNEACQFWEGGAQGTVTIDSIELHGNPAENVIRGSFDLRAENALPVTECAEVKPRLIEIRWTNFAPINAAHCK